MAGNKETERKCLRGVHLRDFSLSSSHSIKKEKYNEFKLLPIGISPRRQHVFDVFVTSPSVSVAISQKLPLCLYSCQQATLVSPLSDIQ